MALSALDSLDDLPPAAAVAPARAGTPTPDPRRMTSGAAIIESLISHGVDAVFGSFGAFSMHAGSPSELRRALERALACDASTLVEVTVPQGSEVSPRRFIMQGGY